MGLLHLARDLLNAKGWLGKVEELRPFKPALGEAA
jgi:hypothetical protein